MNTESYAQQQYYKKTPAPPQYDYFPADFPVNRLFNSVGNRLPAQLD